MMNLNIWSLCILHACDIFNAVSRFTVVLESSSKSILINCNKYTMFMCTHNIKYCLLKIKNIEKLGISVKKFNLKIVMHSVFCYCLSIINVLPNSIIIIIKEQHKKDYKEVGFGPTSFEINLYPIWRKQDENYRGNIR